MAEPSCPMCGAATQPIRQHRTLCFDCTLADLGETWAEIHERSAAAARKAAQRTFQGKAK